MFTRQQYMDYVQRNRIKGPVPAFVERYEHFAVFAYDNHRKRTRDIFVNHMTTREVILATRNLYRVIEHKSNGDKLSTRWLPSLPVNFGIVLALEHPLSDGDLFDLICHDIQAKLVS